MVGYFLVCFLAGVLWAVCEVRYDVKYLQFPLPPHPQQWSYADPWIGCRSLGCRIPAVANDHWQVTGALLWAFMMVFSYFARQKRTGQVWVWLIPMQVQLLNLLCVVHSLKANEAHGVQHFTSLVLCSSGNLLKVSTCWQSEEMTVRARKCQLSWGFPLFFFLCCAQKLVLCTEEIFSEREEMFWITYVRQHFLFRGLFPRHCCFCWSISSLCKDSKAEVATCHIQVGLGCSARGSCPVSGSRTQVVPPLHFCSRWRASESSQMVSLK